MILLCIILLMEHIIPRLTKSSLRPGLPITQELVAQTLCLVWGGDSQHQEASSSRVSLPSGSSFKADNDKWGLLGMLSTLANKSNLNSIHQGVGIDLRTLILDLASKGSIFRTFASPWAEEPLKEEPTWSLPACYNENQPPPVNHAERRASIVCGPHTGNQGMDVSSGYPSLVH